MKAAPTSEFLRLLGEASRRRMASLLLLMIGASLSEGLGILILVPLLGVMNEGTPHVSGIVARVSGFFQAWGQHPTVPRLLAAFVALVGLAAGLQYARGVVSAEIQLSWVDRVRARAFAGLVHAEYGWLVRQRQSDHVNALLTDINRVGVGFSFGLGLVATASTASIYLVTMLVLAPGLGALALLLGGGFWGILRRQRREAHELGRAYGVANRTLQSRLQEALQGVKLAKILGGEQQLVEGFAAATTSLRSHQLRFLRSQGRASLATQVVAAILLASFVQAGLSIWHAPLPDLLVLVLVLGRLVPMFSSAQQQLHAWLNAAPALQHLDTLMRDTDTVAEPAAPVGDDAGRAEMPMEIELRRVSLRRGDRAVLVLDGVSLRLAPRTTTAVIGASGSGKTTLADVLAGLLMPDAGEIVVGGRSLAGGGRVSWRRSVAYVTQEVFLVHDSVRNNLRWGGAATSTGRDDADLVEALRMAAADFVFDLPQGLDTRIGDGGMLLSGGERQRLALARALLLRPRLLILDEATSALDVDSEARIGEALQALHGSVTVLLIGHRLATLEHADQVIVMQQGRVVRSGTWSELRIEREAVQ